MKPICKKIFRGLCFFGAFLLSGCFPEGSEGCPEDMLLAFYLDDEYEPMEDYDTRIGTDVYLYVFRDRSFLATIPIAYGEIQNSREYAYRKYDGFEGNLDMVGWAVAKNASDTVIPDFSSGETGQAAIELKPVGTRSDGRYHPASTDLYMGNLNNVLEKVDEVSHHRVGMGVSSCRIEVNITDYSGAMNSASSAFVEIKGTMTQMTMLRDGTGSAAVVLASLEKTDTGGEQWQTGRFGVLPSSEGQIVSVDIYAGAALIETLTVPRESLPQGARSGGLIIFDYTIGEAYYYLTIDGFEEKKTIVDEM